MYFTDTTYLFAAWAAWLQDPALMLESLLHKRSLVRKMPPVRKVFLIRWASLLILPWWTPCDPRPNALG